MNLKQTIKKQADEIKHQKEIIRQLKALVVETERRTKCQD